MPGNLCRYLGAASIVVLSSASAVWAAPYMIVGTDQKPGTDAQGKPVVNPTGADRVLIVDLAEPEVPKIVATLPLENSIVGPPTNVAIAPDGKLALVADSMTVAEANGARKLVPTNKVFVIDMTAQPPKLVQTVTVGKQPSGVSISPDSRMALLSNRADGTVSVLKIAGGKVTPTATVPVGPGVSAVEFAPDGKHALALKSPGNAIAVLDVTGDSVHDGKLDLPTGTFPYNVVISPDSRLAITADNGHHGSSDGNADSVSVVDLEGKHPHVIQRVTVGDAPEGLAMSPKGDVAAVVNVDGSNMKQAWFHHPTGSVTILHIDGKTVTPIKTLPVGVLPEPAAFSPDGRYLYVGNFSDQDFSILKVEGTEVTDTGKRFKVPGHPASARMGPAG